jgi:hypothetical protein
MLRSRSTDSWLCSENLARHKKVDSDLDPRVNFSVEKSLSTNDRCHPAPLQLWKKANTVTMKRGPISSSREFRCSIAWKTSVSDLIEFETVTERRAPLAPGRGCITLSNERKYYL